jgi:putative ABC transport system permease protein
MTGGGPGIVQAGAGMRQLRRLGRMATGPAGRGPAAALAVIAALAAFLATAGPRESATLQDAALHKTLTAASATGVGLYANADWDMTGTTPTDLLSPQEMQMAGRVLGSFLAAPLKPAPHTPAWSGLTTQQLYGVTNPAPRAVLSEPPQVQLGYRSALAANGRLVAGSYPGSAILTTHNGQLTVTLKVAVTTATAYRFELRPGSTIKLAPSGNGPAPTVVLQVSGIIRPAHVTSPFWGSAGTIAQPAFEGLSWQGGALLGGPELSVLPVAFPLQTVQVQWGIAVDVSHLTVAGVPAVLNALSATASSNAGPQAEQVSHAPLAEAPSVFPAGLETLQTFMAERDSVDAINALLEYGLFAVALLLLVTCALVVADACEEEISLVLARGGSLQQTMLRAGGRTAVAAGPGLVIGVAAGLAVTPGAGSTDVVLVAAVAVTALGAPPVIAAWRHRGSRPVATAGRADLAIPRRSVRRLVAETTVLIVIVGAVAALRLRGAATTSGPDPYVSSAPVLVAVAAGLIAARVYPLPLRGLARLTAPRRSPVGFLGITRAARGRPAALLPALALVVALAVVALGGTLRAAVSSGQVAASWQQTGADAVIRTKGSQQVVPPVARRAIAAVPGVTHSEAVYAVAPGDALAANLLTGPGNAISTGAVVVNPAQYAALVAATPFPAFPGQLLASPGPGGAVPVIATPKVAAAIRAGHRQLGFAGSLLTVRLAATTTATPALPGGGPFVILPSWLAPRLADGATPNIALVVGPRLDSGDLARVLRRTLPDSEVVFRQAALDAETGSPLVRSADVAFDLGVATAVALSIAAILLGLLLSGRDRTRVAAWLAALGMTRRQARRLAMLDALPLALIAVVGAELAGAVLGPIISPALNLSAFTGSAAAVPVRPDALALVIPAAGAIVLVSVITAVQSALTRRRTRTGVLRLDEGR